EEQVLYQLLRERGSSAHALAFQLVFGGDLNLVPIEAAMLVEAPILGGDDGVLELGRDLREWNELVALLVRLVPDPGLQAPLDLDGGGRRIDPAEGDEEH